MISLEYKAMGELTHQFRLGYPHCLVIRTNYLAAGPNSLSLWYQDIRKFQQLLHEICGVEIDNQNVWPVMGDNHIYFRDKQLAMLVKLGWQSK